MRIDFFYIPARGSEEDTAQLNALLSSARVLSVDREFVADGPNSFWSICVQHQSASQRAPGPGKRPPVDYREVLSPEDFAVFARLRELRKQIAAREAVPPYSIFTNEQLAQMVQQRVSNLSGLKAIEGIGDARVAKYGAPFLDLLSVGSHPEPGSA